MKKRNNVKIEDLADPNKTLTKLELEDLLPLPPPFDDIEKLPGFKKLSEEKQDSAEAKLDQVLAGGLERPESEEEEKKIVESFIKGLEYLFSKENNWTFLQPLVLSMEHCARCQTCNNDCPVYEASGKQEIYRPTFRGETLRRLYFKYVKKGNKLFRKFQNNDIEVNWTLIARLYELTYRCTLCRRCAQSCP
ncbi:MAG: 4Fe-4S dicluster domain-containing protein, partial [Bacteroidota bacterium]